MKIAENQCVQCGLPCLGSLCPYQNISVYYCDLCKSDEAEYRMNDMDICKSCAEQYLYFRFDDLTLKQKAELLGVKLKHIRNIE